MIPLGPFRQICLRSKAFELKFNQVNARLSTRFKGLFLSLLSVALAAACGITSGNSVPLIRSYQGIDGVGQAWVLGLDGTTGNFKFVSPTTTYSGTFTKAKEGFLKFKGTPFSGHGLEVSNAFLLLQAEGSDYIAGNPFKQSVPIMVGVGNSGTCPTASKFNYVNLGIPITPSGTIVSGNGSFTVTSPTVTSYVGSAGTCSTGSYTGSSSTGLNFQIFSNFLNALTISQSSAGTNPIGLIALPQTNMVTTAQLQNRTYVGIALTGLDTTSSSIVCAQWIQLNLSSSNSTTINGTDPDLNANSTAFLGESSFNAGGCTLSSNNGGNGGGMITSVQVATDGSNTLTASGGGGSSDLITGFTYSNGSNYFLELTGGATGQNSNGAYTQILAISQ